jgi:hypothetical protein
LVKFYGVEGTDFFHWNYASRGHSKFGLEKVNGKEQGYPFDAQRIKRYADMTAKQLNTPIYGGDVIIDEKSLAEQALVKIVGKILADIHLVRPNGFAVVTAA